MSSAPSSYPPMRWRTYGRHPSPPIFQVYDLPITNPYSRSPTPSDGSGDEDEDDERSHAHSDSGSDDDDDDSSSCSSAHSKHERDVDHHDIGDPMRDVEHTDEKSAVVAEHEAEEEKLRRKKGKQRENPPTTEDPNGDEENKRRRRRRKSRRHHRDEEEVYSYRPILTIHQHHGFRWNQELFVPSYIKERYICSPPVSTAGSPPTHGGLPSSFAGMDYEVECVEIRVKEGEMLNGLVPSSS